MTKKQAIKSKNYDIKATVAGIKSIVLNTNKIDRADVFPLFKVEENSFCRLEDRSSSRLIIAGTQVILSTRCQDESRQKLTSQKDESNYNFIHYNLPNPVSYDKEKEYFTSCNRFTYSRLQEVHDGLVGVIAETWLRGELVQMSEMKIISHSAQIKLLKNANRLILNSKCIDLPSFIASSGFLRCLNNPSKRIELRMDEIFNCNA